MSENTKPNFVVIPIEQLSEEALHGLINEFIQREGTDYGNHEYSLEQKHQQILKQLVSEKIVVVFDVNEESASIVQKEQLKGLL
jgi:uncharacterized protein